MKQLLLLVACCGSFIMTAQTNTFNGAVNNEWNEGLNWSLNTIPTALNDVIIPNGKSVNINSVANAKTLQLSGTATLTLANNLSILKTSTIEAKATFNWTSGAVTGGGTLNNLGAININPAGSKTLEGGVILNNSGTITYNTSWSVSINDGTINNLPSGIIDLHYLVEIGKSGTGSHLLNNQGLIKKTFGTGISVISTDLVNTGTITSEIGYLDLNGTDITLDGGIYNATAGAQIRWYNSVKCSGTLTGNLGGDMVWAGNVIVSTEATFNFSSNFYWASGNLSGGGTLTNKNSLTVNPAGSKSIIEKTILKNNGLINLNTDWNISINDGTINNTASGIIDFQVSGSGIVSDNSENSHVLINDGLLKKTGNGISEVLANLTNTGTISSEKGSFQLKNPDIVLNGGIYNVSEGADLQFLSTVTLTNKLSGNVVGPILWNGTVTVPTIASLQFAPNSNFNWVSGTLTGGGILINYSTFITSSAGVKHIDGGTTLSNESLINLTTDWEIMLDNGTINNTTTGIIDFQIGSSILKNTTGTHVINNAGLIKKTAGTGTSQLYVDVNNTGKIESSAGIIAFDNLNNTITGTVSGTAAVQLANASGSLTNNGIFSPGGSPGTLTFSGNYTSTNNAKLAVELNGLTPNSEFDVLNIQGDAEMNGNVVVTLGFEPAINDEFIIATTTGIITFGMATTTTAIYNGNSYDFNVMVQNDNKLKLILVDKTLAINKFNAFENNIILAPNPAKDYINIRNESREILNKLEIIDLSGRTIKIVPLTDFNNDTEIKLQGMASGQYFLNINTNDKSCVKRFIIK